MTTAADPGGAPAAAGVSGMRLVIFSERYEETVAFFRDGLGLAVADEGGDGRRQSTLFAAGPAGIEVVREERRIGSGMMLRLEVGDVAPYPDRLAACGLRALGPVDLPWGERMCGVGGPGDLLVDLVEAVPAPAVAPSPDLAVVACVDVAPDPLAVLGLARGAAHVITTPGGVVAAETVTGLAAARRALGVERVVVVQHSPCCFTAPGPLPAAWPATPAQRLQASLARLLRPPLSLPADAVEGVLWADGEVTRVGPG